MLFVMVGGGSRYGTAESDPLVLLSTAQIRVFQHTVYGYEVADVEALLGRMLSVARIRADVRVVTLSPDQRRVWLRGDDDFDEAATQRAKTFDDEVCPCAADVVCACACVRVCVFVCVWGG